MCVFIIIDKRGEFHAEIKAEKKGRKLESSNCLFYALDKSKNFRNRNTSPLTCPTSP